MKLTQNELNALWPLFIKATFIPYARSVGFYQYYPEQTTIKFAQGILQLKRAHNDPMIYTAPEFLFKIETRTIFPEQGTSSSVKDITRETTYTMQNWRIGRVKTIESAGVRIPVLTESPIVSECKIVIMEA